MKKEIVIVELKTTMEADKAVLEVDDAVREITAALDSGKDKTICIWVSE